MRPDHRSEDDVPTAGSELADLVRSLWLATAEGARANGDLPKLPGTTVGAMQHLMARDGMTPAQLAVAMGMTRPRVSDLVNRLVADGMIERLPSPADGRSVILRATAEGAGIIDSFRRGRYAIVDDALGSLSAEERDVITTALPALQQLLLRAERLGDEMPGRASA